MENSASLFASALRRLDDAALAHEYRHLNNEAYRPYHDVPAASPAMLVLAEVARRWYDLWYTGALP